MRNVDARRHLSFANPVLGTFQVACTYATIRAKKECNDVFGNFGAAHKKVVKMELRHHTCYGVDNALLLLNSPSPNR